MERPFLDRTHQRFLTLLLRAVQSKVCSEGTDAALAALLKGMREVVVISTRLGMSLLGASVVGTSIPSFLTRRGEHHIGDDLGSRSIFSECSPPATTCRALRWNKSSQQKWKSECSGFFLEGIELEDGPFVC